MNKVTKHNNIMKHNREMIEKLKKLKFLASKNENTTPIKQHKILTKAEDVKELAFLRCVINNVNNECNDGCMDFFSEFKTKTDVLNHYINNCVTNSNFKLSIRKNEYFVSYRCGYFYHIDDDELFLDTNTEYNVLVKGYKEIKNSNQLIQAQMNNSIKLLSCDVIGYNEVKLNSIL